MLTTAMQAMSLARAPRRYIGYTSQDPCLYMLTLRQEQCYDNLRITKNAWDTNLIKVSSLHAHATTTTRLLTPSRQTPNTSQSTGRPAAAVPLPSSPSTSAAELPTNCLSSADTQPLSSTPTGTPVSETRSVMHTTDCPQVSLQ